MKIYLVLFFLLVSLNFSVVASDKKVVAIIGGGMAGVSTMSNLKGTGHKVYLFEERADLGGNAQTVEVENARGEKTLVDIGPQYFTEGPWDRYIEFLQEYDLYRLENYYEFDASIGITNKKTGKAIFVTPKLQLKYLEHFIDPSHINDLIKFKKFISKSKKILTTPMDMSEVTVEDWVQNDLDMDQESKDNLIYPFLASVLGTTHADTLKLSIKSLARMYAFKRHPLVCTNKFSISKIGMGTMIKKIGESLKKEKNFKIKTNSKIVHVTYDEQIDKYKIVYENKSKKWHILADSVIFATHPYDVAKILNGSNATLIKDLQSLRYIEARLLLHRKNSETARHFVNTRYEAHFNIIYNPVKKDVMTTMDLGKVDAKFEGILKSWVNDNGVYLKMRKDILKEVTFYHPLMTTEFIKTVKRIKFGLKYGRLGKHIAIAGGWTMEHETQDSAIISGEMAIKDLNLK